MACRELTRLLSGMGGVDCEVGVREEEGAEGEAGVAAAAAEVLLLAMARRRDDAVKVASCSACCTRGMQVRPPIDPLPLQCRSAP